MSVMVWLILGIVAFVLSVLLFKLASSYGRQAVDIKDDKEGDKHLASRLYQSETELKLYAIGATIVGIALIGYYLWSVII